MIAKTQAEFIRAWHSHVRELAQLALQHDIATNTVEGHDLYLQIEKLARQLIEKTADANYPSEAAANRAAAVCAAEYGHGNEF